MDFADRFIDAHVPEHVETKEVLHKRFPKYCELVGATNANFTIRKLNSALKQIVPEFRNNNHDTTYRLPGAKPCKVWYDTKFKEGEFRKFEEEVKKSKKA